MAAYTVKLRERETVAEGTMAFTLARSAELQFGAGQYFRLTLIDPPESDAKGNSRTFSIASPPHEREALMVATRMRDSAFKRVLKGLPIGSEMRIAGPYGSFILHADGARPAVFLMGGIGITPARSIVLQATKERLPHRLVLFYANRRPEDAAFLRELADLERGNPTYRFVGTMTQPAQSKIPWQGETGYITQEMLARYLDDPAGPVYYVAGPSAMVASMRAVLTGAGVNDGDIRTEEFEGY